MLTIPRISVDDVFQDITKGADVILLDVRTLPEYQKEHIKNSIHLPIDEISDTVASVVPENNKKIYVYCLSGSRSDMAVSIMQTLGYKNLFSMTHGLLEWRAKKYPLV